MKFIDHEYVALSAGEFFLTALFTACGVLALAYVACMIVGVTP